MPALPRPLPARCRTILSVSLTLLGTQAAAEERLRTLEAPTVEMIGETPLPGIGVGRNQVPSNVQSFSGEALKKSGASNLPEFMADTLPSVSANSVTGNPFQMDLAYRGFYASPLMGMPQGLAVVMDGMRMNESFGDTVSWDLIPRNAVAGANLLAGANPAFGLNALGGALSLGTKSGETHPGSEVEALVGSFGRRELSAEHGGNRDGVSWFVAGNALADDGWRDHSPSRLNQLFAKFGRQSDDSDLDVSFAVSDSKLAGNGFAPASMLGQRWEAVYSQTDWSETRGWFINAKLERQFSPNLLVAGNVYYRDSHLSAVNPDVNEVVDDRFGVSNYDDDDSQSPASINRQKLDQNTLGLNLQATLQGQAGRQLTFGLSAERGRSDYRRSYQLGNFNAERGIDASGAETDIVNVSGRTQSAGLFTIWHQPLAETLSLTAAARYNHTLVKSADHMPTARIVSGSHGLDADYSYSRINPALGLTWDVNPKLTAYASASQSNRAPTPIELACADPAAACMLPNAMQSDPPLLQVVTTSMEAGARGRLDEKWRWNAGVFRADNRDDILFIATTAGGAGYFQNFGRTRRQGLELGLSGDFGKFDFSFGYSLVDASYQSDAAIMSPNNSSADPASGNIQVHRGDQIPGIPRHQLKLGLGWKPTAGLRLGAQLVAFSEQYARGNENNADPAGVIPGYSVVNLNGDAELGRGWQLFGRIGNVFDKRYATAGQLATNAFPGGRFETNSANWATETFLAPGAPRALFLGLRYRM